MLKSLLIAVLFAVLGLALFALVAPLVVHDGLRQAGATALPFVVVICGTIGFLFGRLGRKKD